MKEAIKTATKAGLFTAVSNQIANSTVLRRIPGMASVREGMELKKRELYERTGRDESGRKLTKRELEDRELRRKDAGALASIWELLDQDWRNGVPVVIKGMESAAFAMMFGSNAAGGERFRSISREYGRSDNVTVAPSEQGAYDIQDESSEKLQRREEAAEQERADDADQDRDQEKEEGFFTNLFSKTFGSRDRSKSGSLIDSLLGIVGPLLGLFGGGGGIVGMLSGIITPMLGALASAGTALMGVITPLLPFIVGAILVGAAGLAIKSWIDDWTEDQENDAGLGTGMRNVYHYKDPTTGVSSLKTAEELGTTDEAIKSGTTPLGLVSPQKMVAEFRDGKLTGGLAKGIPHTKEEMKAYREYLGEGVSREAALSNLSLLWFFPSHMVNSDKDVPAELREGLFSIDTSMLDWVRSYNRDRAKIADSESMRNSYLDSWNNIQAAVKELIYTTGPKYGIEPDTMASVVNGFTEKYKPFAGMFERTGSGPGQVKFRDIKAEPVELSSLIVDDPYDIFVPTQPNGRLRKLHYEILRQNIHSQNTSPNFIPETADGIVSPEIPIPEPQPIKAAPTNSAPPKIQAKPKPAASFLTVSAENVGKASGGQAPVIINNNSPTNNVMASATARQAVGIDMAQMFNGARLATI